MPRRPAGHELYYIIGLRNLWLGLLAVAFAALRQWRALALWFAMGTIVCFADAAIAASSTGKLPQVAFHIGCGIGCAVLAADPVADGAPERAERSSMVDVGFILAVVAFGWGLSLAGYRVLAGRYGWPMGAWQMEWPAMPITLGIMCVAAGPAVLPGAGLRRPCRQRLGHSGVRGGLGGVLDRLPAGGGAKRPFAGPSGCPAAADALARLSRRFRRATGARGGDFAAFRNTLGTF